MPNSTAPDCTARPHTKLLPKTLNSELGFHDTPLGTDGMSLGVAALSDCHTPKSTLKNFFMISIYAVLVLYACGIRY